MPPVYRPVHVGLELGRYRLTTQLYVLHVRYSVHSTLKALIVTSWIERQSSEVSPNNGLFDYWVWWSVSLTSVWLNHLSSILIQPDLTNKHVSDSTATYHKVLALQPKCRLLLTVYRMNRLSSYLRHLELSTFCWSVCSIPWSLVPGFHTYRLPACDAMSQWSKSVSSVGGGSSPASGNYFDIRYQRLSTAEITDVVLTCRGTCTVLALRHTGTASFV